MGSPSLISKNLNAYHLPFRGLGLSLFPFRLSLSFVFLSPLLL